MAKRDRDRAVLPSLLDRLTDEFPREVADRSTTFEASARAYRTAVQRDLKWLLNTRRTMVHAEEHHPQLRRSVHQFGLPDATVLSLSNVEGRQRLADNIADTIRRFEPRLSHVHVILNEANQGQAPQLRFSITATLLMDHSPEQVMFDTVLEVASGVYDVDGSS